MKILFTSLLLLSTKISIAQTNWKNVSLTTEVAISFPDVPIQKKMADGIQSFTFTQPDSTANLIAVVTNFNIVAGLTADALEAEMQKEETWEQAKNGFLTNLGKGAKLIKDEIVIVQETKVLKMLIEQITKKGIVNTHTVFIFVKDVNSYNIIFTNRGGKADEKIQEQFFSSLQIKKF